MSTRFFKSTHSGANGTCVEIAHRADAVLIRDSKYSGPAADQPIIAIAARHWHSFLDTVRSGASGLVAEDISLTVDSDGSARIADGAVVLAYDAAEWDAFVKGVADGQFGRPVELSGV
ncbi:DUF397 domain-containing protein [Nocardia sp. CDC159]|uniref:DUF397 domain-containing protein n=1 Tax=Nocardia pulmonis TaxID=2951408 RepID=A0A9X2ED06_9NOCA|nr:MULTISPECIES: DUF397 domain-containing protein [Nocardia]MCM6778589.1 DUF397 domain-containing protein [Nocardia pulmonis]MCM6791478.1 DUF397 domain-containing protein [Nocardia sp. CDC159]